MSFLPKFSNYAIIFCNGLAPSRFIIDEYVPKAKLIIAADGGANIAYNEGIVPSYIIGDMDSYHNSLNNAHGLHGLNSLEEKHTEIINISDQETNDLEKALDLLCKLKNSLDIQSVIVLGASGKRADHFFKNISVMVKYNKIIDISIIDDYCEMRVVVNNILIAGYIGQAVSLIPLSGYVIGISTKGLLYKLDNEALEIGVRDGTSNELSEENAIISIKGGILLVILNN